MPLYVSCVVEAKRDHSLCGVGHQGPEGQYLTTVFSRYVCDLGQLLSPPMSVSLPIYIKGERQVVCFVINHVDSSVVFLISRVMQLLSVTLE